MDKMRALKKGASEKVDEGGALAWLHRMYAMLRAMFTKDLPELEEIPEEQAAPFVVVAWTKTHADARDQIRALTATWDRLSAGLEEGKFSLAVEAEQIRGSIEFYRGILEGPDEIRVIAHQTCTLPEEVDALIASMAERFKGRAVLTLRGPGIALRLNRKARRAATARTRRMLRREDRAEARQVARNDRADRARRDRDRRARLLT